MSTAIKETDLNHQWPILLNILELELIIGLFINTSPSDLKRIEKTFNVSANGIVEKFVNAFKRSKVYEGH